MVVFQVSSITGIMVSLEESRWLHVLEHPEMKSQLATVRKALVNPDEVRKSLHDPSILMFYKLCRASPVTEKYLLVVVKTHDKEGFIVTAFFTDKMKKGGLVWKKKP